MKNFYKSFMAIRLRTVSTFYNSKTWFPSENRVRFNGRSQSYYAIGSRCNLGRVIVVRPIRNQLHNCGINRTCVIVKLLWKRPWHFVHGLHIMETFDGAWKLWNYLQFFKIKSPPRGTILTIAIFENNITRYLKKVFKNDPNTVSNL